ncbi:MAG: D-alanyl-D-alanine carboxypeptidase family protein [Chthoniobacteraceae bacterium]
MVKSLRSTACILAALLALPGAEVVAAQKKKVKTEAAEPELRMRSRRGAATPAPALSTRGEKAAVSRPLRQLAEGELPIQSQGAIVLDAYTGEPLYEKNADQAQYPASTTKIMTALLVIEAGDLDREVEITDEDSKVGESSLTLLPGEHYTRRQMLFGLMLKSANDVAHALGRDNAGSAEAFAAKMTLRAKELGATNTSFRNANGLHDPQHYTSPRDLALIARAAMSQPYFRRVVSTQRYSWQRASGEIWALSNHNRLLFQFPGCTGVKTGYTNPAQQVLVSAALRDQREVIAVTMHGQKPANWEDSTLLLGYGFERRPGMGPVPRF